MGTLCESCKTFFYAGWVEIEGDWVNIGQHRSCARPQNGADGGEEAEGCGDNGGSWTNAGRGQSQPEGVGTRSAPQSMGYVELACGGYFEGRDRLAEDELLSIDHLGQRRNDFISDGSILARKIQHGNGRN